MLEESKLCETEGCGPSAGSFVEGAKHLVLVSGGRSSDVELRGIDLLRRRILKRSKVLIENVVEGMQASTDAVGKAELVFLVGTLRSHQLLRSLVDEYDISLPVLPDTERTHPEGFAARTLVHGMRRYVVIVGADQRGVIYGIGAVLRSMTYHSDGVDLPQLDAKEKPAFWLRGTEASAVGPRSGAMELGKMRPQREEEIEEALEDLILLGANIFHGKEDFVQDHGLMIYSGYCANSLPRGFPQEWAATPSNSLHIKVNSYFRRSYVCPSMPKARRALLDNFDRMFRNGRDYDFFATNSGDVGGCTCEKCMPWGATYIRLVHKMADILHKYHPETKMIGTNQNLTNEGDQAILDYFNENNTGWFYALRYGPGGNEMSTYNRPPLNPRWFEYEGFGPTGNYLKYVHRQLPTMTDVVLFSDVTHWIRSQYGVDHPDVALAVVYNRRAWNARPRHYHKVARETFHYAIGDMFYSEGIHDDFNKWFWLRMLWNPELSAEEITREYCRHWFGSRAEEEMTRAIFTMEDTMEKAVLGNDGIAKAVEILRSARSKIPANLMEKDYRWCIIMQKALLDRYIQLWLERGEDLKRTAGRTLEKAVSSTRPERELREALGILGSPQRTEKMFEIKEEVRRLGEKSNGMIGYREPAFFNVDDFDITEIGWWIEKLQSALDSGDPKVMTNTGKMVLYYEDPGEGGHYERVGWPWEPVHLIEHQNILGYFPFTGPARLHHYGMGYSWGRRDARMTFVYDHLDPEAEYVVRICTGFHCDDLKNFLKDEIVQSLEANGIMICEGFPLPLGEFKLFQFNLPAETTRTGKVRIVIKSRSEEFPAVGLCGIWLMRRDKMPWTLQGSG